MIFCSFKGFCFVDTYVYSLTIFYHQQMKGFICHIHSHMMLWRWVQKYLLFLWYMVLAIICCMSNINLDRFNNIQSRHQFIRFIHIYFLQIFFPKTVCRVILQQNLCFVISWPWCTEELGRCRHHHHTRLTSLLSQSPTLLSSCCKPGFTFILIVQHFKSLSLHSLSI